MSFYLKSTSGTIRLDRADMIALRRGATITGPIFEGPALPTSHRGDFPLYWGDGSVSAGPAAGALALRSFEDGVNETWPTVKSGSV